MNAEEQYLQIMRDILDRGDLKKNRTGIDTKDLFGVSLRHDYSLGFPLLTTKKMYTKAILHELLWLISGETNISYLQENDIRIWNEWADKHGNLGPVYGHMWRNFGGKNTSRKQPKPRLPINKKPTVLGVAFGKKGLLNEADEYLYRTWKAMINRCYKETNHNYSYYGKRGVFVDNRWLVFDNFADDAKTLPGWEDKKYNWSKFELDKDVLGDGFCYSRDVCSWISKSQNQQAKRNIVYIVQNSEGKQFKFRNQASFAIEHGLSQGNFSAVLRGERQTCKGWKLVEKHDFNQGVDQLKNTIEQIKNNPNSRRHVISTWYPPEIQHMALPPCHGLVIQFNVRPSDKLSDYCGYLDVSVYQRSADWFLGVPFNIASYSFLLYMIAEVTGYKPGQMYYTFGSAHLYKSHFSQAKIQLERKPYDLPSIEIKHKNDIDDFVFEDFKIVDYKSAKTIKAKVAV